ncbi:oligogalacturonate lyase family protein [Chloroflexi bacterium TSY]|nr:oligogalacturonate lyase family protein [Chloroflexi bacterium TSY]
MSVGQTLPAEWSTFVDPLSGVTVQQLTNYRGHSHHFYFTNPGWHGNSQKLLFSSDRNNRTNLYTMDLNEGQITQLTDLEPVPLPREVEFLRACTSTVTNEAYFWHDLSLIALNLDTLNQRVLYEMPSGWDVSMCNTTADGKYVCASISEDKSDEFPVDLLRGYVGFRETWAAKPKSHIMRVAVDGSGADSVWEENYWVGHVNTSPTQPQLLTFCHEGPWDLVDNRIWGLNMEKGDVWQIRPREEEYERVGHEYWHEDGIHVSYHGHKPGGDKFFGQCRYDGSEIQEYDFPHETGHIHSNGFEMIVGDGGKEVRLWKWNGNGFDGPRALCQHRSSMHIQQTHVHPRFSPDGSYVIFTSDVSGYGNVYKVDVPEFESLPLLEN